jgi:hypothetical protein
MPITLTDQIPLPDDTRRISSPQTKGLPWKEMKVGDSFLVPWLDTPHNLLCHRINGLTAQLQHLGTKFMTRSSIEGIRVWRVR